MNQEIPVKLQTKHEFQCSVENQYALTGELQFTHTQKSTGSVGCRSPPPFRFTRKPMNRNGGYL